MQGHKSVSPPFVKSKLLPGGPIVFSVKVETFSLWAHTLLDSPLAFGPYLTTDFVLRNRSIPLGPFSFSQSKTYSQLTWLYRF